MRARYLVLGLVLVLAAVTGVLIYQGNRTDLAASASDVTVTESVTVEGETPAEDAGAPTEDPAPTDAQGSEAAGEAPASPETPPSAEAPAAPTDGRPASNVPMTKLNPGDKPPQFIIFSFDGAGSHQRWNEFMDAAAETNSRFTGFLSGIYLLGEPAKQAAVYEGPGHAPGKASIGYGGPESEIFTEVEDLNRAYSLGHEIGTHYNGHFCADNLPGGNQWTTADWDSELTQFFEFMTDWKALNGYTGGPELTVPTEAVKGGRTPCLEGEWEQLVPAWKTHNLTYDSSIPAPYAGIAWPVQRDGIWEFYMPSVYSPGFDDSVMAMDYNMWIQFNQGEEDPSSAPELRGIVKGTYDFMWDQAYNGSRAPILIANHFNKWNGDSFNPPAMDFMREKCGQPETYCATYQDVIAWMELQDPAVLAELQALPPVAGEAP